MKLYFGCTPDCAKPVACPTCGTDLPPIGRAVPLERNIPDCCDKARMDPAVNSRHIWNLDELDIER